MMVRTLSGDATDERRHELVAAGVRQHLIVVEDQDDAAPDAPPGR